MEENNQIKNVGDAEPCHDHNPIGLCPAFTLVNDDRDETKEIIHELRNEMSLLIKNKILNISITWHTIPVVASRISTNKTYKNLSNNTCNLPTGLLWIGTIDNITQILLTSLDKIIPSYPFDKYGYRVPDDVKEEITELIFRDLKETVWYSYPEKEDLDLKETNVMNTVPAILMEEIRNTIPNIIYLKLTSHLHALHKA